MNGEYKLSKTPNAPSGKSFSTNFKDYPGGVEYFEVYHGPIKTVYSEVFWTTISNKIPDEIVKRFDGKVMAIVGLEIDQVRKTENGDVSVPITLAYNHHHDTAVVGKGSEMKKFPRDHPTVKSMGRKYARLDYHMAWAPIEHTPSKFGVPTSAMFSDGNGGEYRKSFHAYAPPFVQLVDSPQKLSGSPMQIDTWNRDKMNITGGKFVPGPYPRNSLAPRSGPDARYSGLLECPLTTRIQKLYNPGSATYNDSVISQIASSCEDAITSSEACFSSIKALPSLSNITVKTETVSSASLPAGCSLSNGPANEATVTFNADLKSSAKCDSNVIIGEIQSLVTMHVNISATEVRITIMGPADNWFGIAFGATLMRYQPNAIIVEGNTGAVHERKLGNHFAGNVIATSVKILKTGVENNVRTVVLTRALKGLTKDHYSFSRTKLHIDFLNAVGSSPTFGMHKASNAGTLYLLPGGNGIACVCNLKAAPFGQGSGFIKYIDSGETVGFPAGRCRGSPREVILDRKNPTCDLREYQGGLATCHHGWKLLDADQEIPWQDQPLEYYKKFRIYFQEYNASFHKQVTRDDWGIAADSDHAEYDVPQCEQGTSGKDCTYEISGVWKPVPDTEKDMYLVASHHHCHAPTCLKVEMWNNDTGSLICRQEPVYGGTNQIDLKEFDEPGYIATPPCLWGRPEDGLEPPPLLTGVTIKVTAVTNNTYGHHGEMALPEVSLAKGPF